MKPMAIRLSKPAFATSTRGCQFQVLAPRRLQLSDFRPALVRESSLLLGSAVRLVAVAGAPLSLKEAIEEKSDQNVEPYEFLRKLVATVPVVLSTRFELDINLQDCLILICSRRCSTALTRSSSRPGFYTHSFLHPTVAQRRLDRRYS
jgi:hypothetical protein